MTDEELLFLAAKAAGLDVQRSRLNDPMHNDLLINGSGPRNPFQAVYPWNPLRDDGDALRLADAKSVFINDDLRARFCDLYGSDFVDYESGEATRRAITTVVAEEEKFQQERAL